MIPEYPYDLEELKQIERLLDKVPEYKAKIAELSEQIEAFSLKASKAGAYSYASDIDSLIFKAFYIDMENRPFNETSSRSIARLKAETVFNCGEIKNRNIPCEICGENRSVDRCHIIPSNIGGTVDKSNTLFLCPTHHRLLDRFMLSKAEWAVIDWERKSVPSQKYAMSVTLEAHKVFWAKIEKGEFERAEPYHVNEKAFTRYVVDAIGSLFIAGRLVQRNSLYNLLDVNIREVGKKVINQLVNMDILKTVKSGRQDMLILATSKFEVSDELVLQIWQKIG